MAFWFQSIQDSTDRAVWEQSVRAGCRWAADRSMIRTAETSLGGDFANSRRYSDWRGAFRGEYSAARRAWDVYAPVWHGGQGVKALVMAAATLREPEWLDLARDAADFILRHRVADPADPDGGLLLAYEDTHVNTTAIVEALDGLFMLSDATGDATYREAALAAVRWVAERAYLPGEGLFREVYDPDRHAYVPHPSHANDPLGAPILDDGVFLTAWRLTGEARYRAIAIETADRLLADEDPPGNWRRYAPLDPRTGALHPRCGWWWGRPLWRVARETGQTRYLDACRRVARWYARAMRTDGGLFRDTTPDLRTPSFGHVTSAVACACILWHELAREFGDTEWTEPLRLGLNFCRSMQFSRVTDENLRGAVLEKVLHPAGADAPPWYLRDIGTFFYIQAVCAVLADDEPAQPDSSDNAPL